MIGNGYLVINVATLFDQLAHWVEVVAPFLESALFEAGAGVPGYVFVDHPRETDRWCSMVDGVVAFMTLWGIEVVGALSLLAVSCGSSGVVVNGRCFRFLIRWAMCESA